MLTLSEIKGLYFSLLDVFANRLVDVVDVALSVVACLLVEPGLSGK